VLVSSERKYCWLVAGGWFVVREKYCWLVADKPSEQGEISRLQNVVMHPIFDETMNQIKQTNQFLADQIWRQ
jgi:hypothetical protein